MRKTLKWSGVAVVLLGLALQVSCKKIDSSKLEKGIADHFKKETGIALDGVSCPSGRSLKTGDTFDCTAKLGDKRFTYKVTQKDDEGNVEWMLTDGVVVSSKLEKLIGEELKKRSGTAPKKVNCGERIRPSTPKSTFECLATDPDDNDWRVGVTVTNTEGGIDFKVIGRAGAAAPDTEGGEAGGEGGGEAGGEGGGEAGGEPDEGGDEPDEADGE